MMKTGFSIALVSLLALSGCNQPSRAPSAPDAELASAADEPTTTPSSSAPASSATIATPPSAQATPDRWSAMEGKWIGPEGLVAVIKARPGTQLFDIDLIWGLDDDAKGTFTGTPVEHGIAITRDGKQEIIRPSTGEMTGMKWLADKKDCIVLVENEQAWCRD